MPGESAIVVAARHRLTWSCRTPWTSEVIPSTTVGRIANIGALHLPAQTSVTFGALAMDPGTPWFACWRTHANERADWEQARWAQALYSHRPSLSRGGEKCWSLTPSPWRISSLADHTAAAGLELLPDP